MVTAAVSPRLPSLTGLRAVAALAVFASHIRWVVPALTIASLGESRFDTNDFLFLGGFGVSLFFVLSGFVLSWSAGDVALRPFLARRFARVWPAHAVVWLTFILLGIVGIASKTAPIPAIANLALVQAWFPGLGWANTVNGVAWTLSCEAFFYLVFPLCYRAACRLQPRGLLIAALGVTFSGIGLNALYLTPRHTVVSTFPPFRLWEFLLGILAALAIRRGLVRKVPHWIPVFAVLLAALVVGDWIPAARALEPCAPAVGFVFIVSWFALRDASHQSSASTGPWLTTPVALRCGEYSYGFYLVQLVPLTILTYVWGQVDGPAPITLLIVVWFLATAALAVAMYHGVERPAQRKLLGLRVRRTSHATPA